MRAALGVMMLAVVSMPGLARAQPEEAAPQEILVHPDVTTVLHLPDEVRLARFKALVAGLMKATTIEKRVLIRASRRAPVGTEVGLEVWTATMHLRFRLRVARHARDAWQDVPIMVPVGARSADHTARDAGEAAPETEPVAPGADTTALAAKTPDTTALAAETPDTTALAAKTPDTTAPAVDAPDTAAPETPEPGRNENAPARAEPAPERAAVPARSPGLAFSVHAVAALPSFTALQPPGYEPIAARRFHNAVGLRFAVDRPGAWWVLETSITGEWPIGPMKYEKDLAEQLEVSGTWLRAELGMRARLAMRWSPSLYAGIAGHVHLRQWLTLASDAEPRTIDTMNDGIVLVLGTGFHRRVDNIVLGVDFQARRGGPDEYLSVTVLWSVGYVLEQGA